MLKLPKANVTMITPTFTLSLSASAALLQIGEPEDVCEEAVEVLIKIANRLQVVRGSKILNTAAIDALYDRTSVVKQLTTKLGNLLVDDTILCNYPVGIEQTLIVPTAGLVRSWKMFLTYIHLTTKSVVLSNKAHTIILEVYAL